MARHSMNKSELNSNEQAVGFIERKTGHCGDFSLVKLGAIVASFTIFFVFIDLARFLCTLFSDCRISLSSICDNAPSTAVNLLSTTYP